jgi:hypothetical protein
MRVNTMAGVGRVNVSFAMALFLAFAAQGQVKLDPPKWTGDGGKDKSITIIAPKATGLSENESHLPALVQGEFVSNFTKYSAIAVRDRERLDTQYAELYSEIYDDKTKENLDIGRLIPTIYLMTGELTRTTTGYAIQIYVSRTADGTTEKSESMTFSSIRELERLTGIRKISLKLLKQMGVAITAEAEKELVGEDEIGASAQKYLARGVTALQQGKEIDAFIYSSMAAVFDPSLKEAVSRASTLSAGISGGGLGDNIRDDIAWRKQWVQRLTDVENFYAENLKQNDMPYTLFYTNDIKRGETDYENETVPMSIDTYLYGSGVWSLSMERVLQAVYDGLNATKNKDKWGLGQWPQKSVTDKNVFSGRGQEFSVVFELLNNRNEIIGRQTLHASGSWGLNWSGRPVVGLSSPDRKNLTFEGVSAQSISDNMMVRVVSVNEESAEAAIADGLLKIQAITPTHVAIWDSFNFEKGEIIRFQAPNPNATKVAIPNVIWGDPILSIGARAFIHHSLEAVSIPRSVNHIGEDAFRLDGKDNTVISISIGENVVMSYSSITIYFHPTKDREIPCKFFDSYRSQNKKAGTYDIILSARYTLGTETFSCFVAAADSSGDRTAALAAEKKKSRNSMIWGGVAIVAILVLVGLMNSSK